MLLPSPEDDYTPFDNVGSGENGTVEGLIDMSTPAGDTASALRYQKSILVNASSGGLVTGRWKVRVRENGNRGADGAYNGAILFEQEVIWTAMIVILDFGGLTFASWQPTGDAGSGKQVTTIVNGGECVTVTDVTDAAAMAEYGTGGAWQFVDNPSMEASMTPRQKYDNERGFSIFEPEGIIFSGGTYQFSATWQSAQYFTDFAEGAIFETVFDQWQFGTLDTEAAYKFSYKAGEDFYDGLTDRATGQTWWVYRQPGKLHIARTRRHRSYDLGLDPVVMVAPVKFTKLAIHGHALFVLYQSGVGVGLRYSYDEGINWQGFADMIENVTPIDSIADGSSGKLVLLGKASAALEGASAGDLVRVLLTRTDEPRPGGGRLGWKVQSVTRLTFAKDTGEAMTAPDKPKGRLTRVGASLEWLIASKVEVQIWRSTNGGAHWVLLSQPARTNVVIL